MTWIKLDLYTFQRFAKAMKLNAFCISTSTAVAQEGIYLFKLFPINFKSSILM